MNAPIIVFGYNRMEHLKCALEALENSCKGREKELFLFLDGAKSDADKDTVQCVQEFVDQYVDTQNVFEKTHVVKSKRNKGLANSIIEAVNEVIHRFGAVIVVEDDLVVAPHFTAFMDEALDKFQYDDRIWSIGGWIPAQMEGVAIEDAFLSRRAECWGWATWENRWNMIDWDMEDYRKNFRYSFMNRYQFNRAGNDMTQMLDACYEKQNHSWAIRFAYAQWKVRKWVVCPRYSLVMNIGLDGSGTNCHTSELEQSNYIGTLCIPDTLAPNQKLLQRYFQCMSIHGMRRLWRPFKRFMHMLCYDLKRNKI